MIFDAQVRDMVEDIAERAVAAVISTDVYARLAFENTPPINLHPTGRLRPGEWFIVDDKGDILRMHGDRQRIVDVCLGMRAMGVI